jgi:hypothetical protein
MVGKKQTPQNKDVDVDPKDKDVYVERPYPTARDKQETDKDVAHRTYNNITRKARQEKQVNATQGKEET